METIVNRFAKYYTPIMVLACLLLIVVPAAMRKRDLKVSHLLCNSVVVYAGHSCVACLSCRSSFATSFQTSPRAALSLSAQVARD